MGLKLDSIAEDTTSVEAVWEPSPDWPGVEFCVRSINNKDYQQQRELLIQRKTKALNRYPTGTEMEPELGKLVARFLLRGWKGIDGDDEKPLEWTPKVGLDKLADPTMGALERQVIAAASRVGDREAQFNTDAVKN